MNAEQLETALIDEIIALDIVAKPYPENPDDYVPDAYPGEVLVLYKGAGFSKRDVSNVRAERTQRIHIIGVGQTLRGEGGIFSNLEIIRQKLDGYTIPGTGGYLELESEEFMDINQGIWQYGQQWRLKNTVINEQQDDYADRLLGD